MGKKSAAKRAPEPPARVLAAEAPRQIAWIVRALPVLIMLGGVIAYHNSLHGPFILDDRYHIVENDLIRHLWPPWRFLLGTSRPVVLFSLALNYAIGGLDPTGYHIVNIAIHILASLVLYGVVRRTLQSDSLRQRFGSSAPWLAALIASLWLVHPLQTESVTYTIQRGESLMGLFYLVTLYCAIRNWNAAAVVSCLLGMATKGGVMITAPIAVMLYDRAFRLAAPRWKLYAGLAVTWLSYPLLLAAAPSEWKESAGFTYGGASPLQYGLTQSGVILRYLRLALWPAGLSLDYGWPIAHTVGEIVPAAIGLISLLAAVVWCWRRNPALGYPGAWFFLILIPTSSFIPIADAAVEHRMYLPLAGIVALAVVGLYAAVKTRAWMVGLPLVLILTATTVARNEDYVSMLSIWQDTAAKSPNNPRAQYDAGFALEEAGRIPEAIDHYRQAVRLKPQYADALANLGHLLTITGHAAEAEGDLRDAIRFQPNLAKAHNLLGHALVLQGKVPEAIEQWQGAIQMNPAYAEPHNNLAIVLAQSGRRAEAVAQWKQALEIDPNFAEAHHNLGAALLEQGQAQGAIPHFESAIRIKPDYFQPHYFLARTLAGRDPARAVVVAQQACRLPGHGDADCLDLLAQCYAAANRWEEARRTEENALAMARSAGALDQARQIETRLAQYRDSR